MSLCIYDHFIHDHEKFIYLWPCDTLSLYLWSSDHVTIYDQIVHDHQTMPLYKISLCMTIRRSHNNNINMYLAIHNHLTMLLYMITLYMTIRPFHYTWSLSYTWPSDHVTIHAHLVIHDRQTILLYMTAGIKIRNFYKDTLCLPRHIFGINAQTHGNEWRSHKSSTKQY
jgi:hypothetical protein